MHADPGPSICAATLIVVLLCPILGSSPRVVSSALAQEALDALREAEPDDVGDSSIEEAPAQAWR